MNTGNKINSSNPFFKIKLVLLSLAQSNDLLHMEDRIATVVMVIAYSSCKRVNMQVLLVLARKSALGHLFAGRKSHGCLQTFADEKYAL